MKKGGTLPGVSKLSAIPSLIPSRGLTILSLILIRLVERSTMLVVDSEKANAELEKILSALNRSGSI